MQIYTHVCIYAYRGGEIYAKDAYLSFFWIVITSLFSLLTVIFDNLYTKLKGAHTPNVTAIDGEMMFYQYEIWLWHVVH